MSQDLTITFEWLKIISPLLALLLTWFVGTRILHRWEIKKKKKELDISTVSEFYKLYGEFTSVWRLWKIHYDNYTDKSSLTGKPQEAFWELLKRSSNVEGGMEAVFLKVATEKILTLYEKNSLGLFRQAVQQLRQSIREYNKMDWQREHPEYILLKNLSAFTAALITQSSKKTPDMAVAAKQLREITQINSGDWKNKVGEKGSYWHEYEQAKKVVGTSET